MRGWSAALFIFTAVWPISAGAREEPKPRGDDGLRGQLEALQRRLDDPTTNIVVRENLAIEMASQLDKAAQASPSAEIRRAHWAEAVSVLDNFRAKNANHALSRQFEVQAAVYLWANARSWIQALETNPTDLEARKGAIENLDASLARLRAVAAGIVGENDVFAQNVRFRLARAIADRADVGTDDPATLQARYSEAVATLEPPISEPSLVGFARLLRASVLARLERFVDAEKELDLAAKSKPAPPEYDVLETRLAILLGRRKYAEAIQAIDSAQLEPATKPPLRVRARLLQRAWVAAGKEREAVDSALFEDLKAMRGSGRPDARAALSRAAKALNEPGPSAGPDAWDVLAEGALALGDPLRAASLIGKAADAADGLGRSEQAADFRLKAGAYLYQAEKFREADPLLTRVAEDPKAGPARAKAGLLRALARGRALALNQPGASRADYASALQFQIKTFPDDPSCAEAHWLLGKLRTAESDREAAALHWSAIPRDHPHWLDSRLEIAASKQTDLDLQRVNGDREAIREKLSDARKFLAQSLAEARSEAESNELLLAQARLELTPGAGRPDDARRVLERIEHSVARPAQRDAARRIGLVALAATGRFVEAEQAARAEAKVAGPAELLDLIRLLDRMAAETEADLAQRRIGLLSRVLMTRVADLEKSGSFTADDLAELRLRNVRAMLFSGYEDDARRMLVSWKSPPPSSGNDNLRDLAETYSRFGVFDLAIDVQRLRAKQLASGSLSWFDARYGMALAYFRAGKPKEALHLIDATAILHPDLGGGELKNKYIRLRQRIEAPN